MAKYYVNRNAQPDSGDHEVHKDGCSWMPRIENRILLGDFASCAPAVKKAKDYYNDVDGCVHCSPACHTG